MNQNFNDDYEKKDERIEEESYRLPKPENHEDGPAYYNPKTVGRKMDADGNPKPQMAGWKKGLIIFLIVAVIVVGAGVGCTRITTNAIDSLIGTGDSSDDYIFDKDYIGVLQISGTMTSGDSTEYNQKWLLDRIKDMKNDSHNRGIVFDINTPGGEVYAVDQLYFAIKDYEEETGRPVYTYMESMCASGGYYTAAATEKIYANRNCWTGSIGVTIGTIYDVSEFLKEHGIKTVTITSGKNKAMGSSVDPLTDEQKAIYQSLVDEAYEQFVGIVADGRKMDIDRVKELADGRVYTAKQAQDVGLVDEIGTLNECINDMKKKYEISDASSEMMTYEADDTLRSLLGIIADSKKESASSELDNILKMAGENSNFTITYMSEIRK